MLWSLAGLKDFGIFELLLVGLCNTFLSYISSVYSPFSDGVGVPLHNSISTGVLVKSIGAFFL